MIGRLPIFKDHDTVYQADTCAGLRDGIQRGRVRLQALVRGQYPGRIMARDGLSGVSTVGYWDADLPQDWGLDWHRNEGIELTYLESGSIDFAVDQDEYQLQPGDLTCTRPWQLHRVGNPHVGPGRLHWLILDVGMRRPHQPWKWPSWLVLTPHDREELTALLRQNEQPVWPATAEIRRCFQKIGQAVELDEEGSQISRLTILLNELMWFVLEMLRRHDLPLDETLSSTQRTVDLFWQDLRGNHDLLGMPWSLRNMAKQCGLGITHFVHFTKQLFNMTPAQYLNHCRVELAARLLREEPQMSITDVSVRCGFATSQYFATVFRRGYGCTPRQYRLQHGGE